MVTFLYKTRCQVYLPSRRCTANAQFRAFQVAERLIRHLSSREMKIVNHTPPAKSQNGGAIVSPTVMNDLAHFPAKGTVQQ